MTEQDARRVLVRVGLLVGICVLGWMLYTTYTPKPGPGPTPPPVPTPKVLTFTDIEKATERANNAEASYRASVCRELIKLIESGAIKNEQELVDFNRAAWIKARETAFYTDVVVSFKDVDGKTVNASMAMLDKIFISEKDFSDKETRDRLIKYFTARAAGFDKAAK